MEGLDSRDSTELFEPERLITEGLTEVSLENDRGTFGQENFGKRLELVEHTDPSQSLIALREKFVCRNVPDLR